MNMITKSTKKVIMLIIIFDSNNDNNACDYSTYYNYNDDDKVCVYVYIWPHLIPGRTLRYCTNRCRSSVANAERRGPANETRNKDNYTTYISIYIYTHTHT